MISPLEMVQADVLGHIQADANLSTIAVLDEVKGVSDADLNQTLSTNTIRGGKKGAGIIVCMPFWNVESPTAPGPKIEMEMIIRCIERPIVNRHTGGTMITAEAMAIYVAQLLHHYIVYDLPMTLNAKGADGIVYETGDREYSVRVKSMVPLKALNKVPSPVISGTSEEGVTITSIPDAIVYYTTDGSYPWSGNESAQLLNVPLLDGEGHQVLDGNGQPILATNPPNDVAPGTLVRAVAYLTNYQASDLAGKVIS